MTSMDDDKTVFRPKAPLKPAADGDRTVFQPIGRDELLVDLLSANGAVLGHYAFSGRFTAGRAPDNDIVIADDAISRYHLEIKPESGGWWLYNLKSMNGVYIDGRLVQNQERLILPAQLALGLSGVRLRIQSKHPAPDQTPPADQTLSKPTGIQTINNGYLTNRLH